MLTQAESSPSARDLRETINKIKQKHPERQGPSVVGAKEMLPHRRPLYINQRRDRVAEHPRRRGKSRLDEFRRRARNRFTR